MGRSSMEMWVLTFDNFLTKTRFVDIMKKMLNCLFSVIGEISYKDGSLVPDLSFGSHFFQDLIESQIFYLAIYPEKPSVVFNGQWFAKRENKLDFIVPSGQPYNTAVRVIDTPNLVLRADIVSRRAVCYLESG